MRNRNINYALIVGGGILLIILCVVLFAIERQFNKEKYHSSVRLRNAKAQFFESRAKNVEYQKSCTPVSDALDLIADALDKPTRLRVDAPTVQIETSGLTQKRK